MFTPTRDEARRFFVDAWAKYRAGAPIEGLEKTAVSLVALHPGYHSILEAPERHVQRDFVPEGETVNPFLHLSLHLAVAEQLAIDQPRGIRAHFERLRASRADEHAALHALLECLGETLWQAQRLSTPPDERVYLECLERQR
jgi:Domain of unknown function (DUF1841)